LEKIVTHVALLEETKEQYNGGSGMRESSAEYPMKRDQRVGGSETLQAFLLFLLPVSLAIPLYVCGILQGLTPYYLVYSIYILGSIAITRRNGRQLHEIGLTGRNLTESLLMSSALVLGNLIGRLRAGAHIASGLTLSMIGQQALYNFVFSGPGQEILFRGLILSAISRWKGAVLAVVISSVLFGIMHARMGIAYVFWTAVIGGFYGYVAYKTGNVVGPMLIHGLYNFLFDFLLTS